MLEAAGFLYFNQGKYFVIRENSGDFIFHFGWVPCYVQINIIVYLSLHFRVSQVDQIVIVHSYLGKHSRSGPCLAGPSMYMCSVT
jgi:hypothetical protein